MKDHMIIFTAPRNLSDKSAYHLCEFFHDIAMALESHYATQTERYWKKLTLEDTKPNQYCDELIE